VVEVVLLLLLLVVVVVVVLLLLAPGAAHTCQACAACLHMTCSIPGLRW
jgi:hypothetical protein